MSALSLYNTMVREVAPFVPRTPGELSLYCCGPTVYDVPHAGHARAAVAFDLLVRQASAEGLKVTYVRNITDVDDKILQRSAERGEAPLELSARMARVYQEQIAAIGCREPQVQPKVSEHIAEIIELVSSLVAQGKAYAVDREGTGSDVYFSVRSFPDYGKLSRRKIDELKVGARVERDELKRDPLDFALWKGAGPEEWGWESPWGWGRPGWHIECSAMSTRYLGQGFDIHGGGMDLIFPHHENEIAQNEAATGTTYACCWMHNGFVNVDKEKMSKSLGNFVTVADVLGRNDAEAFRYFLLTVHYRGPIQFDTAVLDSGRVVFPSVDEAERRTDYLYGTWERLVELEGPGGEPPPAKIPPELVAFREQATAARDQGVAGLNDDLNSPVALAALGELARLGNNLADLAQKRRKDRAFATAASFVARHLLRQLHDVAERLGLLQASPAVYRARTEERRLALRGLSREAVEGKLAERVAARQAKDFALSDQLRGELASWGVVVMDTPQGSTWSVQV